ncbi:MAG: prepilin-type N-terminal cleavage/methylation domain-containing protein [Candidatus Cloacimonetes bacterium]|nr:prepilin-type N-terminal cleavage/methylation domain-containing protein [Candidatus Cloacimonadota bacterium]
MRRRNILLLKPLSNQRGVSLVELIAVMAISVILIMSSAGGIALFFRKYNELRAYAELQSEGIELLNYIKNGIPVGSREVRLNNDGGIQFISPQEYYGVNNAVDIRFLGAAYGSSSARSIRVVPIEAENVVYPTDYAEFYQIDGALRSRWRYKGGSLAPPVTLFPKGGKNSKMVLEDLSFRKINTDAPIKVLEVSLKASVEVAPQKFKKIHYRTKMAKK